MQVKKQQLELDMEQWTGSKLGKEYIKAVYCHPVCLTSMQKISCKMPGWMNHKLESRFPGEISITSNIQMMECLIAAKCVQGSEDLPVTKTLLSLSMRAVRTAHQGTRQLAQGTRE